MDPSSLIAAARRITVKVGSSLLVGDGAPRSAWLASLAADIQIDVHAGDPTR